MRLVWWLATMSIAVEWWPVRVPRMGRGPLMGSVWRLATMIAGVKARSARVNSMGPVRLIR
ncbi:hypothetical protein [Alloactinosynnema sp. L-07]|uniref:hypothetical protein n=1 Tax=Alloactinosynnema sp. L-07 TaxID=1653480 RepID=UPI0012FB281E|nr:hypothetical protein [Alloactinosynnema sp. L-07]